MPRYVAFLRGVSPLNLKMPDLKRCLESAGFTAVRTVISSGNAAFDSRARPVAEIERKAQAAMLAALGREFYTIVRTAEELRAMLAADFYGKAGLPPGSKRLVGFLREPRATAVRLPWEAGDSRVIAVAGREVFASYVPAGRTPTVMVMLEKLFGAEITTRTWETVEKCAKA